jgi:hypothetical protein
MGTLYIATPGAGSGDAGQVSTGTTLKTLLQVATPSTTSIRVYGWGLSFEGTASTGTPVQTVLADVNVAATVTTLTPDKWESTDSQASLCVGGTSATGTNASAEGTITDARLLDAQLVHPQSGYAVWFPETARPLVKPSRFLRVRVTAAASVDSIPWIVWGEPS